MRIRQTRSLQATSVSWQQCRHPDAFISGRTLERLLWQHRNCYACDSVVSIRAREARLHFLQLHVRLEQRDCIAMDNTGNGDAHSKRCQWKWM